MRADSHRPGSKRINTNCRIHGWDRGDGGEAVYGKRIRSVLPRAQPTQHIVGGAGCICAATTAEALLLNADSREDKRPPEPAVLAHRHLAGVGVGLAAVGVERRGLVCAGDSRERDAVAGTSERKHTTLAEADGTQAGNRARCTQHCG